MKTKNLKATSQMLWIGFISALLTIVLLFSCQKNSLEKTPEKNNMATVSELLGGDLLTGNVAVESDENEIAINYNNGDKYILVTKIPHTQISNIDDMQSANIITSKYGIILKDLDTGKVFFLMNNDSKSISELKNVQSQFTSSLQSDKIFGTTIINSEKS